MLLEYACRVARVRKRAGFIKRTQPHSTEKEGFEPSRLLQPTGVRSRTLQPLGYFSIYFYNIIILAEKSLICKRKFYSDRVNLLSVGESQKIPCYELAQIVFS